MKNLVPSFADHLNEGSAKSKIEKIATDGKPGYFIIDENVTSLVRVIQFFEKNDVLDDAFNVSMVTSPNNIGKSNVSVHYQTGKIPKKYEYSSNPVGHSTYEVGYLFTKELETLINKSTFLTSN